MSLDLFVSLRLKSINPCFNGRYSLRAGISNVEIPEACLNPCFNGRYSLSAKRILAKKLAKRLNPCFNVRYSLSYTKFFKGDEQEVLILVLMEDTH